MKRLVFVAALSFAASAFADTVQSSNIFGVLKIDGTSTANLAVCVPWVAAGTGGDIKVADIVMASNRETGDVVYYYDATAKNFKAWELQDGAWTAVSSVSSPSGVTIGETAASQTAARGGALIVHRENATSFAKPIYLYGQYAGAAATTAVAQGTAAAPVISLIAPPSTAAAGYDMNATGKATVSAGLIGANDYIMLSGSSVRYQYKEGAGWGFYGGDEWNSATSQWTRSFTAGLVIPAGQGALYVSKGGNPTFTW